jgi:hypothetical protein
MKILVVIANHGTKNRHFAERLLAEYRSMSFHVDVVFLSDAPKDYGPGVEVRVGAPTSNPWSLPFAHKKIFAERIENYDLFIYSEDDTLIRERSIRAYLDATAKLREDEIAGFIRYEVDPAGNRFYSSVHTIYRLEPGSIVTRGGDEFAYFTNLHSACFILTRAQLRKAIASGGFLVEPYAGRFDMLCTAATDPYTHCGFRRLLPISRLEDFELHHLPNVYLGRTGVPAALFHEQIEALRRIQADPSKQGTLFDPSAGLTLTRWDKTFYEPLRPEVLRLLPSHCRRLLSVGCGHGATETALIEKGIDVTVIPMDGAIAAPIASRGGRVLEPDFDRALAALAALSQKNGGSPDDGRFDAILFLNVLQFLPDPAALLSRFTPYLSASGRVIASGPNFHQAGLIRKRWSNEKGWEDLRRVGDLRACRVQRVTPSRLRRWLRDAGLVPAATEWKLIGKSQRIAERTHGLLNRWLAFEAVLAADWRNGLGGR